MSPLHLDAGARVGASAASAGALARADAGPNAVESARALAEVPRAALAGSPWIVVESVCAAIVGLAAALVHAWRRGEPAQRVAHASTSARSASAGLAPRRRRCYRTAMHAVLAELLELLGLERLEESLFRGQSQDLGWGTVFGGQVLGQALSAAQQTVPEGRTVHSLHGYFLRPGDTRRPIIYDVDRIRDGKSFTTRRVVAIQNGKAIFSMGASFQIAEDGFSHQAAMPDVPGPEGLPSETELARLIADRIPAPLRARAVGVKPIEVRQVAPINPLDPGVRAPERYVWYRSIDPLPDDPKIHRFLLAYASDFHFMTTALFPHGVSWLSPGMQTASLDHAMWFHRDFRIDDWLLYAVESPSASHARGLARGHFFNRKGELVASTVQEGLLRKR